MSVKFVEFDVVGILIVDVKIVVECCVCVEEMIV